MSIRENISMKKISEMLKEAPTDIFLKYDKFVDEFILGVDISIFEYKDLIAKRESL